MGKHSHVVCMTVTQRNSRRNQPLLLDADLAVVGTHPAFLYGLHGVKDSDTRRAIAERGPLGSRTQYAEMTFSIPGHMRSPLQAEAGPTLQVFDTKSCLASQRDDFINAFVTILGRHYDEASIHRTLGEPVYKGDVLPRLTAAYAAHLPEAMRLLDLKIGIFTMRLAGGRTTSVAMIARDYIQSFIKDIKTDVSGRAFSYRIADGSGAERHIDLPPASATKAVPHLIRKGVYQSFTPTVQMTIISRIAEPDDVIELDSYTVQGFHSNVRWIVGAADHRCAPHEPKVWEKRTKTSVDLKSGCKPTRTLLTLSNRGEAWPDCSRNESLASVRFFHADYVSSATLRSFIAAVKGELSQQPCYYDLVVTEGDDRKAFDRLVLEDELSVLRVLDQTNIDVAVLPRRRSDQAIEMVTLVRGGALTRYLQSIDTLGATATTRYAINFNQPGQKPTWISPLGYSDRQIRTPGIWTEAELAEWDALHDETDLVVG